jgi:hypothetical protein
MRTACKPNGPCLSIIFSDLTKSIAEELLFWQSQGDI